LWWTIYADLSAIYQRFIALVAAFITTFGYDTIVTVTSAPLILLWTPYTYGVTATRRSSSASQDNRPPVSDAPHIAAPRSSQLRWLGG
jgi:hypothetical protein